MAEKSVNEKPTGIHPLFTVPDSAIDLVYTEPNISYDETGGDGSASTTAQVVPVPQGLRIVSQTLRTTKSGQEVVDVVFEVTDIIGVSKYDLRVTPIDN